MNYNSSKKIAGNFSGEVLNVRFNFEKFQFSNFYFSKETFETYRNAELINLK